MTGPDRGRSPAGRGSLPTLLAVIFVDLLGFSLILPLLPYYAETFGATPAVVGFLVASYALAQLIGAPILGGLSDRYGRRPVLIVSILGSAAGFVIFGLATSLTVLFAARILDGLTGGNISVAQAYVADVSPPEKRARNFGLIGAAFGLGFIIGPALGGFMSRWGYAFPAYVAAGMATLNAIAVFFFLPESVSGAHRARAHERRGMRSPGMRHLRSADRAGGLLRVRFFFAFALITFESIFALFSQYHLGLDAEATGYILGYAGVLIVLVQGGGVGLLARHFSEERLIPSAIVVGVIGLLGWAMSDNVPEVLIALVPLALAGGVFRSIVNSALSHAVAPTDVGSVLGVGASLESVTRALGPSIGGVLLGRVGPWAPGVFGAAVLLLLLPYAIAVLRRPAP